MLNFALIFNKASLSAFKHRRDIGIMILSMFVLTACQEEKQNQNISLALTEKTPIGLTVYSMEDLYIQNMMVGFENTEKKIDNLKLTVLDGKNNQENQINQVAEMVDAGNQALLVNMVDVSFGNTAGQELVDKSKVKNVPIVFFNRHPGSKVMKSYDKAYYIGSIAAQSGILQGEMIVADWQNNPEWDLNKDGILQYVILKGQEGHADAEGRTKWVSATINSYPTKGIKAEKMDIITANWRTEEAKNKLKMWLSNPSHQAVEIVITNNDAMAFGALDALEDAGLVRPVYGVDAMPEALKLIKAGKMAGTVLQDAKKQAEQALILATNLGTGRDVNYGLDFKIINNEMMVPYVAINKTNIDQYSK